LYCFNKFFDGLTSYNRSPIFNISRKDNVVPSTKKPMNDELQLSYTA